MQQGWGEENLGGGGINFIMCPSSSTYSSSLVWSSDRATKSAPMGNGGESFLPSFLLPSLSLFYYLAGLLDLLLAANVTKVGGRRRGVRGRWRERKRKASLVRT